MIKNNSKPVPEWYLISSVIIAFLISILFFFSGYDLPSIDNFYFLVLGVIGGIILVSWIILSLILVIVWKRKYSKQTLPISSLFLAQLLFLLVGFVISGKVWYYTHLDLFTIITIISLSFSLIISIISFRLLKIRRSVFFILLIIIFLGLSFFAIKSSFPVKEINKGIPFGFLYTSPGEMIPEEFSHRFYPENIKDKLVLDTATSDYYCTKLNKFGEKIFYFSYSSGRYVAGGGNLRYAVICEEEYWIIDHTFGEGIVYGPFKTPDSYYPPK